ncbi:VWFA and cache domain-containing protein 1-like [Saccoglossus kowalevskii]|uniref:Voltage-dependent calcium channel subunit alpha-2/delta-4-like n=1 Tax=Saccoglossus kowalevskii TaxID=10224 RepID=A0ABM0MQG6_SACKO|nr:PREDICTED: voltage-dependent calcium channel subunit alpha-2/delta-4-like [Saccoglossus kowalevskii]
MVHGNNVTGTLQFLAISKLSIERKHSDNTDDRETLTGSLRPTSLSPEATAFLNIIVIRMLRDSVHEVFQSGVTAITSLQAAVKKSLQSPSQIANNECCQLNVNDLTYSTRFGKPISENYACERISPTVTDDPERLSNDVVTVMKENNRQIPQIKWQYYGTEQGMMTIYPANKQNGCDIYDNRYRPWYVETKSPHPKNIVIVLDNSGSMRQNHGGRTLMEFAKESIKTVLYTLNPNDKVSVISFSDAVRLPIGSGRPECFGERLAQATPLNIDHLNDFLQSLPIDDSTKYLAALNTSFDLLIASRPTNGENRDQVILFVTDGKPDDDMAVSSTDSVEYVRNAAILKMIIDRNNEMGNKVSIFTYGLGSDVDSDLLEAMATQNGSAYGIFSANKFYNCDWPSHISNSS